MMSHYFVSSYSNFYMVLFLQHNFTIRYCESSRTSLLLRAIIIKYLRIFITPFILQCQHDILLPRSGFGRTLNPLRETSTLLELAVSNPYDSSNTAPRIIIRSQVVRQQRRRNQVIKRKPEHVLKTRF